MFVVHLNHFIVLHYHQEFTDTLDLKLVGNDFILAKDTRQSVFCKILMCIAKIECDMTSFFFFNHTTLIVKATPLQGQCLKSKPDMPR